MTSSSTAKSVLHGLDPLLSSPKRLGIMAVLCNVSASDFAFLRDHLGLTDSDLSKQAASLESAGYLVIRKSGRGRGSTTSYRATRAGKSAYARHRTTLTWLLAADSAKVEP